MLERPRVPNSGPHAFDKLCISVEHPRLMSFSLFYKDCSSEVQLQSNGAWTSLQHNATTDHR